MSDIRWQLDKKIEDWFLGRVERVLRKDFPLARLLHATNGQIVKHPVDITSLKEEDLDIVAVYFVSALLSGDEDYTVWNWLIVECFSNSLHRVNSLRKAVLSVLVKMPVTHSVENPMRDEHQGIISLSDKYELDDRWIYQQANNLF